MATCRNGLPVFVRACCAILATVSWGLSARGATVRDKIGYTKLAAELGAAMPTGAGVVISQVEALWNGNYKPESTDFAGKTITLKSGSSTYSWHATEVGKFFYGNAAGIAPGITTVDVYNASSWYGSGFLKTGMGYSTMPTLETRRVQNHSWIIEYYGNSTELIRRFDYMIHNSNSGQGVVAVVGTSNATTETPANVVPDVLAHNYNGITVGLEWAGSFGAGTTRFDAPGRVKPDIVAPIDATSWGAAIVSGAATMMIQKATGTAGLGNAANSEVVKAILMAGATKETKFAWDRTPTRPLDEQYGAGQLNVYNSYHVLTGGEQAYSTTSDVTTMGWDFAATPSSTQQTRKYFFQVPPTAALKDFSVILTWDRLITSFNPNVEQPVANLDLKLYSADGYNLGALQDSSVSTVDNVEHVFRSLLPGRYALEVSSDTASTDFGLAWYSLAATPGDINLDGTVDLQDFGILKDNFGATNAIWTQGDCNGDGQVDLQDFGVLKNYFGTSLALTASDVPAAGALAGAAIPEPTVLALLAAGLPALRSRRRHA